MRVDKAMAKQAREWGFKRTYASRDVTEYERTYGDRALDAEKSYGKRKVTLQFWADGRNRASHFLRGHMSTRPTGFTDVASMRRALRRELTRRDHKD